MRHIFALAGLAVGVLSPVALTLPADAVGETCNGLAATMVGTPGSTVTGSDGADVIVSDGAARVDGKGGDDVICTTGSVQTPSEFRWVIVQAGPGNDLIDRRGDPNPLAHGALYGDAGQDIIYGSPAGEYVGVGDGEADHVETFGGDDQVVESFVLGQPEDPDTVDLGPGDDDFTAFYPFAAGLSVTGGDGEDRMGLELSQGGSWVVDAGAGRLEHGTGAAFSFGGFESYSVDVWIKGQREAGNVTFLGTGAGEQFSTNARRMTVKTAGGDDTVGLSDANQLVAVAAGPGRDTVSVAGSDLGHLTVDLQHGRVRGSSGSEPTFSGSVRNVEDAEVFGGDVVVRGTRAGNSLTVTSCLGAVVDAGSGNDEVTVVRTGRTRCHPGRAPRAYGGAGDDTLTGSDVADLLDGGRGHDQADGGDGRDSCVSVEARLSCERR
jgi:Ca2+-binding RTX toxin-like protein